MSLTELQGKIFKSRLDAFIVTRNNCFIGQDILEEENAVRKLTNFSGSSADLLVFADKAYLFVDGRYDIQARQEVDLEKVEVIVGKKTALTDFLVKVSKDVKKLKIGYNAWCHTVKAVETFKTIAENSMPNVTFVESDLYAPLINAKESLVFEHVIEFSGVSRKDKIAQMAAFLDTDLDAYFISAADSVSWLLNIRSNLLETTPIVRAMALVNNQGEVVVFSDNIDSKLKFEENVVILPLSAITKALAKYKKKKIAFCAYAAPAKILDIFKAYKIKYVSCIDPCQRWKAQKNIVELEGIKNAHIRDAWSVVNFLYWLERHYAGKTELDVVDKLFEFRQANENFFSNSFDTIAGFGSNGAIVHYHSTEETNKKLLGGNVLLLDSGAQYLDGTTDITRTIAIGEPTQEMRESYTQVLKAHIALADAVFPDGTSGMSLDFLCRSKLWKYGKDYAHGTGHGVGCFLNVHEGPIGMSTSGTQYGFKEGVVTSIEPGYYEEGAYGIRIENLYKTVSAGDGYLKFEALTLVPFDKRLINIEMLNAEERRWVNEYHKRVYVTLANQLDEGVRSWLEVCCYSI